MVVSVSKGTFKHEDMKRHKGVCLNRRGAELVDIRDV